VAPRSRQVTGRSYNQPMRAVAYVTAASLFLACCALSSNCSADGGRGRPALFGPWKWTSSEGGMLPGSREPVPGCSLVVYLHRNGTYAYWERDSLGDNLLCRGKFKIQGRTEWSGPGAIAVEFQGWCFGDDPQLVTFEGEDQFHLYPGGRRIGRLVQRPPSDALTETYARVSGESEPKITSATLKSGMKLRHVPAWVRPDVEMQKSIGDPPKTPVR